jgi:hypothetical protein
MGSRLVHPIQKRFANSVHMDSQRRWMFYKEEPQPKEYVQCLYCKTWGNPSIRCKNCGAMMQGAY